MKWAVKGLVIVMIGVNGSIAIPMVAVAPIAEAHQEWHPENIQTLLSHPLADDNFVLNDKLNWKYILYTETISVGLAYKDYRILYRIAQCESSFRHYDNGGVLIGRKVSTDTGLFQINKFFHIREAEAQGLDIYTPEGNIKYAVSLYKSERTKPWSASKNCWIK